MARAEFLRKGLGNSCGPDLVLYGPADTYCIKVLSINLTIRTYTTGLRVQHTHSHPPRTPRGGTGAAAITTVAARCSLAPRPTISRLGGIADALGPRTALASPSASRSTKRIARPTQPALPRLGIAQDLSIRGVTAATVGQQVRQPRRRRHQGQSIATRRL